MDTELVLRTALSEWNQLLDDELDIHFAALIERQSRFVFRVAYAVLRNTNDAEDVVQDTFLKLLNNRAWRDIRDERAFLARTAWRLAVVRRPRKVGTFVETPSLRNPETSAIAAEQSHRIHALIDGLPEKLRRPLALSAIDELTAAEIAGIMGEPEGTVRRRISEARALLKEKLQRMENRHA